MTDHASETLARELTYLLIRKGVLHNSAFTAASRAIQEKLTDDAQTRSRANGSHPVARVVALEVMKERGGSVPMKSLAEWEVFVDYAIVRSRELQK